jgi:uncharacterized protein involved in exopolysaccharide biosynthesis
LPAVLSLEELRLSMVRDRAAAAKGGKEGAAVAELDARIEATEKQLGEIRTREEARAKARLVNDAETALAAIDARLVEIKKKLDEKRAELRRLDSDVERYRALEEDVRAARETFNQARKDFNAQEAICSTMQPRVELRSRAVTPAPKE